MDLKYRELLLDYQKLQQQNSEIIEQNEILKNMNEEIKKESSDYKNKYNTILKEQKKNKILFEDMSLKYNANISFRDEVEKLKIKIDNLILENEELKKQIDENNRNNLDEQNKKNNFENELKLKEEENNELKKINNIIKIEQKNNEDQIKTLKEKLLNSSKDLSDERIKNKNLSEQFNLVNNNYNLLKEKNSQYENDLSKIMEENSKNKIDIEKLNLSNENYKKEINIIKLNIEENQKNYDFQIKEKEDKFNDEINKYLKEIQTLKLELEQKNKKGPTINSIIKEISFNIIIRENEIKVQDEEKIKLENINQSKNINGEILNKENKYLVSWLKEILSENEKISSEYQKNVEKLKRIFNLNSFKENNSDNIFINEGILSSKNLNEFLNNSTDEIAYFFKQIIK